VRRLRQLAGVPLLRHDAPAGSRTESDAEVLLERGGHAEGADGRLLLEALDRRDHRQRRFAAARRPPALLVAERLHHGLLGPALEEVVDGAVGCVQIGDDRGRAPAVKMQSQDGLAARVRGPELAVEGENRRRESVGSGPRVTTRSTV